LTIRKLTNKFRIKFYCNQNLKKEENKIKKIKKIKNKTKNQIKVKMIKVKVK